MDNIETLHHKKTAAANIVGFKLEADLQICTDVARLCLPWTTLRRFLNKKMVVAETVGCIFKSEIFKPVPLTTLRRFTIRKWSLQKLLVSDLKQTSSNQYR